MANKEIAVKVQDLSKSFNIPVEASNGIKQKLINVLKGRKGYRVFTPLNDISLEIEKGDFFGIVGRNGSGKSTLLKAIAGIYTPNGGLVYVNGTLVPFIELGVGFNPELSGKENVYLNGALLGFSHNEIDDMYDEIVDFAELKDFMEERLKNYSSGMQVRLAFSIAIKAKGDVLVLDEVLAVGDALFQKKCYEYFKKLKHDKKTVVLVSHDTGVLQEYCNKGVLIEEGKIASRGEINGVISDYIKILNKDEKEANNQEEDKEAESHIGSGRAVVKSISVKAGINGKVITDSDSDVSIVVSYGFNDYIDRPIYGITIHDAAHTRIVAVNDIWSNQKTVPHKKGDTVVMEWLIPNVFNSGTFFVTPAIATSGGSETLDQADDLAKFKVSKKQFSNAVTNLKYEVRVVE